MLENLKEKCNVIEMFPQNKRDFSAMIPQSILAYFPTQRRNLTKSLI